MIWTLLIPALRFVSFVRGIQNGGGSSTGSAGAVAANEVAFALGTETDGSVISPSERNGLVGLKPTVGLTSRKGVIPESEHQDTVGVLARSVADAAAVLGVVAGVDERDDYTAAQVEVPGRTFSGEGFDCDCDFVFFLLKFCFLCL